jgi:peptidoglycan/xylan/chitin deacetylase (PgdA/CDA1 family)
VEIVLSGPGDEVAPKVALTFDDGPGDPTEALLDLLATHSARATFFVLGGAVQGREEVVRRTVREGHELGNHTWSHTAAWRLSDDALRDELARSSALLRKTADVEPAFARPPYGRDYARFATIASGLGMRTALWSVDPHDWAEPPAEQIVTRVLRDLHPGAVVDLHDGWQRDGLERSVSPPIVPAITELLPALASRGYACVTLSELLAALASPRAR